MTKLLLLLLFLPIISTAKTIKIAVIDTGYFIKDNKSFKSCNNFKDDYNSTTDMNMEDRIIHGQNVLHIITKDLENVDYCIVNVKIITSKDTAKEPEFNIYGYELALSYVVETVRPDIINISMQGLAEDDLESYLLNIAIKNGTKVVVAAGNHYKNLDKKCNEFPACSNPKIITVGCIKENKKKCYFTNYGKYVKVWEKGMNITAGGLTMSGTSQAAAVYTNRLIKEMSKKNP